MTQEWSGFWTTSGVGDGVDTGYTQTQLATLLHALAAGGDADTGVQPDYGDALAVAAGTEKVTMGTGMAAVYGYLYVNPVDIDFTVISPVASTRIDRVVLRADWNTQTVRAVVLNGAEGGSAPSLTQSSGSIWEIPIAQFSVTVGGTIIVTDQRKFLGGTEGTTETSDAAPLTLVLRDANARAKIGAPSAASDIARKDTVDNHAALTGSSAHGAVSAATANKIITRDKNGRAQVAAPSADADIARLDTFKDLMVSGGASSTGRMTASVGSYATLLTVSGLVTTRVCNLLVMASVRSSGNSLGNSTTIRFTLDGATSSLSMTSNNVNGITNTVSHSYCFKNVAPGTHSVVLEGQMHRDQGIIANRSLTVWAIPTGA
mgnify:CR=1 FL=1